MISQASEVEAAAGTSKQFEGELQLIRKAIPAVSLWTVLLSLGGLILLGFAASNEFLPDVDLSSGVSLLAAMSVVFLALVLGLVVVLLSPGYAIRLWLYSVDAEIRERATGFAFGASLIGVVGRWIYFWVSPGWLRYGFGIVVVGAVVAILTSLWVYLRNRCYWHLPRRRECAGVLIVVVLASLIFTAVQTMMFMGLYQPDSGEKAICAYLVCVGWLVLHAVWVSVIAGASSAVALTKTVLVGVPTLLCALLVLTRGTPDLVERTVRLLGVGAMPDVSLVVTRQGCEILAQVSRNTLCDPGSHESVHVSTAVTLVSRFGSQSLVRYTLANAGKEASGVRTYEVVIPSEQVLGWQRSR